VKDLSVFTFDIRYILLLIVSVLAEFRFLLPMLVFYVICLPIVNVQSKRMRVSGMVGLIMLCIFKFL
jgi:hypothetical protein